MNARTEDAAPEPQEPRDPRSGPPSRPLAVVRLLAWFITAGLSLGFIGVWAAEMAAPTTHRSGITYDFYCVCAQLSDGRVVNLAAYDGFSALIPNGPWDQSSGERSWYTAPNSPAG